MELILIEGPEDKDYGILSNYSTVPVNVWGTCFACPEAALQWIKLISIAKHIGLECSRGAILAQRAGLLKAPNLSALEAKRIAGRKCGWESRGRSVRRG